MTKRYWVFPLLIMAVACGNNTPDESQQAVTQKDYSVVKVYPHNTATFTEGLYLKGQTVYESAGNKGESKLLVYDLASGKVSQSLDLDKALFGEGISELDGKIYQLTWQDHKVFVYDSKTLALIKQMTWPYEGWGMTTDGKNLIISVGSSNIYYVNPADFSIIRTVGVTNNYGPLSMINELEYVDGFIYANVWQTNSIVKIDPASGSVVKTLDLAGIREDNGISPTGDWLNGIAYNPTNKTLLVTGKHWSNIFEIKLK